MCAVRDIIVIENYLHNEKAIGKHSFVVIDDTPDKIEGVSYDMICNAMSSFKDEKQRKRKLSYPGNFPVSANQEDIKSGNDKEGYIKADQLYYFNKNKIQYKVIGQINEDVFEELLNFIENGSFEIISITDNL